MLLLKEKDVLYTFQKEKMDIIILKMVKEYILINL